MNHTHNQQASGKKGNACTPGFKARGIEETLIANGTFAVVASPGTCSGN